MLNLELIVNVHFFKYLFFMIIVKLILDYLYAQTTLFQMTIGTTRKCCGGKLRSHVSKIVLI